MKTQELEFECPLCGSHHYTTYPKIPGKPLFTDGNLEGACNGSDSRSCKFTWDRREDWKHFAVVTREKYDSEEAFKRAYHAMD